MFFKVINKTLCIALSLCITSIMCSGAEAASTQSTAYTYLQGSRNPFKQPFSSTSIWNMPIGSNAQYVDAGLRATYTENNTEITYNLGFDVEHIYQTDYNDEYLDIFSSNDGRWPENTSSLIPTNTKTYWPKGVTIPVTSGNKCTAIIQPDHRAVIQLQPACRADADSTYITGWMLGAIDIYGDGRLGSHWGSGLSTLGGSIRVGELTSDEPIRHVLKLNVPAYEYLYYGDDVKGYMWPADRCDSYANSGGSNAYGGSDNRLVMGTLLAIPQGVTAEDLGITSEVGKKLFFTLQNYGCYISDDSYWSSYDFCVEDGVVEELTAAGYTPTGRTGVFHDDMMKLISNLDMIVNNSETSVGGGGTPLQPLLPELVELMGDINVNGVIDATDYQSIRAYIINMVRLADSQKNSADLDYNSTVNSGDALLIRQMLLGIS